MAEDSNIYVDHLQFSCSICLDLLNDPVTTSCGHTFCMVCINDFWDQPPQKGVYSCPQCREPFMPRPVLRRNNVMADVVEKLKWKDLRSDSPSLWNSRSEDVECDICSVSKDKAIKSCLVCLASFCEAHLKPHFESPAFKKHKLVHACKHLQDKICSCHNKLIDIYCRTDQETICALCALDTHKGHHTASIASERTEKQNQLRDMQRKSQQKIKEKEKKLQDLKQAMCTLKESAQGAVEESEKIFTELFLSIKEKCTQVTELIRAQEKAELDQVEGLLEQLEQEIVDLRKRDAELELLSHVEDHVHFIKNFQSVCSSSKAKDLRRKITINFHVSFDGVKKCLSELKGHLEEFCKEEFSKICPDGHIVKTESGICQHPTPAHVVSLESPGCPLKVAKVQMVLPSEPKTREDFLQYFCHLTLDPNTANEALWLSENNRKVTRSGRLQAYTNHSERFDAYGQVLCKENVCGRCYWEVEWSRGGWVYISISYKGISRKGRGKECWFGHNNQSWSLECSSTLSFWHNDVQTKIGGSSSSRIGVYVDYSAGTLSFYSVTEVMTLLHRVQTTFTQPLYPGFWVNVLASAKLCFSVEGATAP